MPEVSSKLASLRGPISPVNGGLDGEDGGKKSPPARTTAGFCLQVAATSAMAFSRSGSVTIRHASECSIA